MSISDQELSVWIEKPVKLLPEEKNNTLSLTYLSQKHN